MNLYKSQIKRFKKGKQIGPVDVSKFEHAYRESDRTTREHSISAKRKAIQSRIKKTKGYGEK